MFKNKTPYIGTTFMSKLPKIGKEEKNRNIFKINIKKTFYCKPLFCNEVYGTIMFTIMKLVTV